MSTKAITDPQGRRFSARLKGPLSDLVQQRLEEGGHSAQTVVENLLLDWAFGNLSLPDSIKRVRENRANFTTE